MDTYKRTIAKTISFRAIASITTVILIIGFTGDLVLASAVGVIDVVSKLVIYYLHERAWGRFAWGK